MYSVLSAKNLPAKILCDSSAVDSPSIPLITDAVAVSTRGHLVEAARLGLLDVRGPRLKIRSVDWPCNGQSLTPADNDPPTPVVWTTVV